MELVTSGGTITMASGIFDDEAGVDINKPVTIAGQGMANTTIRPGTQCGTGYGGDLPRCKQYFIINANDVSIHDFTLEGRNTPKERIAQQTE